MNIIYVRRLQFIGKSLLWSVLLYMITITIINWEDVIKTAHNDTIAFTSAHTDGESTQISSNAPVTAIVKGIWVCLSGVKRK